jgi:cytochrome c553
LRAPRQVATALPRATASRATPIERLRRHLRQALALTALLPALAAAQAPSFKDTMAQRLLACTGCHGQDGRAAADGYHPRIAGKPAGYLFRQLRAFRDAQRPYAPMTHLLAPLDDAYLREMAAHFAALELPYPAPAPSRADAATLRHGQALAQRGDAARGLPACVACHGSALTGVGADVPGLLGLPVDYLNAQLGAWRTGARRAQAPDCMAQIAQQLGPQDVSALAHWLAAQPLPAAARAAATAPGPAPLRCGSMP